MKTGSAVYPKIGRFLFSCAIGIAACAIIGFFPTGSSLAYADDRIPQSESEEEIPEGTVRASEYDFGDDPIIYHEDIMGDEECVIVPAPRIPFSDNPSRGEGLNGWIYEDGEWYYYLDGSLVTDSWVEDSVDWCYVGSDGAAYRNRWARLTDSSGLYWYNFDDEGRIRRSQWQMDAHDWCYVDRDGHGLQNMFAHVADSSGTYCYYFTDCCCIARSTWIIVMASDLARWVDADGHVYGLCLLDPYIV